MRSRIDQCASALRLAGVLLVCAGWVLAPIANRRASAQTPPEVLPIAPSAESMMATLSRRGDLTLRDASLESALFTISELWGVNIVAGRVEGAVNGVFKDAPLKDILDSILQSNGYAYRPVGGSLIVSRVEALGQVNPFFASQTIPVGAADVGEVVEAARLLSTPQGQVRALPSAGAVLVVDFPDRVEKIRALIQQLDAATRRMATPEPGGIGPRQLEVAYFRTHFVPALQAGTALDVVLSADGRVATVEDEDRLLVVDYPEHIRMVEAVLARLDRPRPQVHIRSLIYDISLSDLEKVGINWNGITDGTVDDAGVATGRNTGLRFLTQTAAPLSTGGTGGSFSFYSFDGNIDLRAVVVALQQAQDSRLLADPNVTVMDNEGANIESIREIPFQQLTQTTGGGNIGTTAFKEVGIKLDVTPKIARDGTIDLTVVPEFSRLAGFTPGDNQPIVETRRATTRVRVADGQTLMIAGLRQRADVGEFNGVPLLKDMRFVGRLFRARDTTVTESELVVFLTPEIVGYCDPLGERNRLAADTVTCRLDYIPAAEGCPTCGARGGCECCGPAAVVAPGEPVEAGPIEPVPAEPARPVPYEVQEIAPTQALRVSGRADAAAAKPSAPRRLPSTPDSAAAPTNDLPTYESLTTDIDATPATPERPLRVDYESRFRATGGVYPGQQRLAERPTPPPPADEEKPAEGRKSFSDWVFGR